jgi:hypothetical protein
MGAVLFSVEGIDRFARERVGRRGRSARGDAVWAAAELLGSGHVDVIGGADDPDRSQVPRHPVAPTRADLDLLDWD